MIEKNKTILHANAQNWIILDLSLLLSWSRPSIQHRPVFFTGHGQLPHQLPTPKV